MIKPVLTLERKDNCAFETHLCTGMKENPELQVTRIIYLAFRGDRKNTAKLPKISLKG